MMHIEGYCFDGQTARRYPAQLYLNTDGQLCLNYGNQQRNYAPEEVQIAARLGNTARQVSFADGASFSSEHHQALDILVRQLSRQKTPVGALGSSGWLHQLESHWRWIVSACLVLLLTLYLGATQGAPLAARLIVNVLPDSISQHIGKQSMEMLDRIALQPSKLSVERQQQLQAHFAPLLTAHPDLPLRVHFRHAPNIGANAFALPSGDIVFTDDIVALAQDDNELSAVLAHEIGHVEYQHGLRRIVQNGLLYWGLFAITGDISAASETIAAAPALLMNMAYSRDMENEADDFALQQMRQQAINTQHFANIMRRLTGNSTQHTSRTGRLLHMLSSHPDTAERIRKFEP